MRPLADGLDGPSAVGRSARLRVPASADRGSREPQPRAFLRQRTKRRTTSVMAAREHGRGAIVARAAAERIAIDGLTPDRQVSRGAGGLVFGYGAVTEAQFPEGIAAVASIMAVA